MKKYEDVFEQMERPFAWLDYDALDTNIAFVNEACADKQIRIATKSVRSINILKYIQQQLHCCTGFMSYTAAESVYLLEQGLDHLLLGYPVMEKASILRLLDFVENGRDVTFMVDHIVQAQLLSQLANEYEVTVQICIDINVSSDLKVLYFGTKRSPLSSIEKLDRLLKEVLVLPGLSVVGVMGYDAQIAGLADRPLSKAKGVVIRALKQRSIKHVTQFRQFAVAHVRAYADLKFVNAGGSGSMQFSSKQPEVTEITVGSAFFAPALFDGYDSLQLTPAAGFALRVTRQFSANTIVCHGGGYVASGAIGVEKQPQFLQPHNFSLLSLEGAGEVQTPVKLLEAQQTIGDTVYFRHAKAGELCERFNYLQTVRGDKYTGPIQTYRGDGQCFL